MSANADDRPARVLLIEDNANLAFGLRNNLEIEGYVVDHAATGGEGLARGDGRRPRRDPSRSHAARRRRFPRAARAPRARW